MLDDYLPNFGKPYTIEFNYIDPATSAGKHIKTIEAFPFNEKVNTATINAKCNVLTAVDIDFVNDATGSMGDEIKYLQEELYDVIEKVQSTIKNIDLRTASIFYRD